MSSTSQSQPTTGLTRQLPPHLLTHPVGFGSAALGNLYSPVDDIQAAATLERAWSVGMRYFDSAPLYGNGLAERRLGHFLSGVTRSSFAVSTKVGRVVTDSTSLADNPPHDYSRDGILRSIEGSLRRLGLDVIDVVFIHDPDNHWNEAVHYGLPTLAALRDEGIARAIGVGMNQAGMLTRFVRECEIDCILIAGRLTLLDRRAEAELLPTCSERGVSVIVGGVFNGGILADPRPEAHFDYSPAPTSIVRLAQRLQHHCARFDVPLAAAALQFVTRHPLVESVLVGTRSSDEVDTNERLLGIEIPDQLWDVLDKERRCPTVDLSY